MDYYKQPVRYYFSEKSLNEWNFLSIAVVNLFTLATFKRRHFLYLFLSRTLRLFRLHIEKKKKRKKNSFCIILCFHRSAQSSTMQIFFYLTSEYFNDKYTHFSLIYFVSSEINAAHKAIGMNSTISNSLIKEISFDE